MFKTSLIALVTVAALAGAAGPALADAESIFGSGTVADQELVQQNIVKELRARGVNATDVEQWGSYLRVYVVDENGNQHQEFFIPGSLQPARIAG